MTSARSGGGWWNPRFFPSRACRPSQLSRTPEWRANLRVRHEGPADATSIPTSSFGFDYAGNRALVNGLTIPFNSDNQNSGGGYGFEGNGNPTTYNGTSLSFDPENRVTAVGSTSTATYRADGLRATKTVGSTTTYYLYDGAEPIIEMNSSGTVTARPLVRSGWAMGRDATT